MNVFIAGAGMGDSKTLTGEVTEKIENADIIIGAKRLTEPYAKNGRRVFFEYDADKILRILHDNPCNNACVLFSGDAPVSAAASAFSLKPPFLPALFVTRNFMSYSLKSAALSSFENGPCIHITLDISKPAARHIANDSSDGSTRARLLSRSGENEPISFAPVVMKIFPDLFFK